MLLPVLLALAIALIFLGWRSQPSPFAVEWTANGTRYKCGRCRKWHDGFPNWHFEAPDPVLALDPSERAAHAMREEDAYVLDRWFFGLVLLEVPVQDTPTPFAWGVWVYVFSDDVERYAALYNDPTRVGGETFDGRLANSIPGHLPTSGMPVRLHIRAWPQRPRVELLDANHPLTKQQFNGLSRAEMESIFARFAGARPL
jgi:hypothetical protein